MTHPWQPSRDGGGDVLGHVCFIIALSLLMLAATAGSADALTRDGGTTITADGTIVTSNGTAVPPFPQAGRWTEFEGKSSDRYDIRHFMYVVPHESPAIELYVTTDKRDETPDGVFETGLVKGFVRGFASKAGFGYEEPVFGERHIGASRTRHTSVQLSNGRQTLWVHAYLYPRKPSLTFIVVTGKEGVQEGIETYLSRVEVK